MVVRSPIPSFVGETDCVYVHSTTLTRNGIDQLHSNDLVVSARTLSQSYSWTSEIGQSRQLVLTGNRGKASH